MRGYLVLRSNPYMAVSDANGHFLIKHLPAGEHRFQFWHERVGWLRNTRIGAQTTDRKGRLTLTIRPGVTELTGDLPAQLFATQKDDKRQTKNEKLPSRDQRN